VRSTLSFVRRLACTLVAVTAHGTLDAQSPPGAVSGIVSYVFEANPQEITPKMYNWEIRLSAADSRAGAYEIVQVTRSVLAGAPGSDTVVSSVIDSRVIVAAQDGAIDFKLYVGDKVPKANMGRRGSSGEPIIFSGIGTGTGASSWIVLPGAKVERATPAVSGTPLVDGRLTLIRYLVSNERGAQFQTEVVLRRK
jgi:hypothetical protein